MGRAPNGLGGLYKQRTVGRRGHAFCSRSRYILYFNPADPNQLFVTTEYEGLWVSSDINASSPTFQLVNSYPFKQPERVFFNPYNSTEMWVTSFGNGMKMGTVLPTGVSFSGEKENEVRLYPNPAKEFVVYGLRFTKDKAVDLEIVDIAGRTLFTKAIGNRQLQTGNQD